MAYQNQHEGFSEFLKTFKDIARHKHRYDVFRDFVTLTACALHNSLAKDEKREAEYMQIIGSYKKEDQEAFPKLLSILVALLENEPRDILGPLYMQLEISSKDQGQFFTPPELSELMAAVTYGPDLASLKQDFITLSEPACGAGGMVLSFVKILISHKHNPAEKLWVQCIDVDRMSALMCYIQLTLWNVPGEVLVGDTLRWDMREVWYTPAHHLGFWTNKLARREQVVDVKPQKTAEETKRPEVAREDTSAGPKQFDFGF